MNKERLEEIKNNPNPTMKDVVEIVSEAFISQSKHMKDLKKLLSEISETLDEVLHTTDKLKSPVFQLVEEEDDED